MPTAPFVYLSYYLPLNESFNEKELNDLPEGSDIKFTCTDPLHHLWVVMRKE